MGDFVPSPQYPQLCRASGAAALRLSAVLVLAALQSACAVSYRDAQGREHIFGLVDRVLPAGGTAAEEARAIDLSTFGLLFFSTQTDSGVALGYARERRWTLKDDVAFTVLTDSSCIRRIADTSPQIGERSP